MDKCQIGQMLPKMLPGRRDPNLKPSDIKGLGWKGM